jgi:ABC-type transporter Mla subunit MlaD
MRRIAAMVMLAVALPVVFALGIGAKNDGGSGYQVRGIFDNAAYAVPGEDVRVAGVTVGQIDSLDVAYGNKAAVTFTISTPGFTPFHKDAHCTIRPQSLIGEKYVECSPGSARSPAIDDVPAGQPGAGKHFVPLAQTSSPIDIDLIGDINRLPYRQRLALVINEFGTALAGRGEDLNQAIHRANPALRQTDKVLAILAKQNHVLANLAVSSDQVLAPLADKRRRISHFIATANQTGTATAERSADIQRSLQRFPVFLRELRPTLQQLGSFTDQMTPVLADLHRSAPDLNRFVTALGPFSRSATTSVVSLGKATVIGRPALVRSLPLTQQLARFAKNALPVSKNLDALTASLDKTGGIERVMDYIFFQTTAVNGFDGVSHYLRAGLNANLCSAYTTTPASGCNANYTEPASSAGVQPTGDKMLDKLRAQLANGGRAPKPPGGSKAKKGTTTPDPFATLRALTNPRLNQQRQTTIDNATGRGSSQQQSGANGQKTPEDQALDYLLGNGP